MQNLLLDRLFANYIADIIKDFNNWKKVAIKPRAFCLCGRQILKCFHPQF